MRYVGTPGMNTICRGLLDGVEARYETRVWRCDAAAAAAQIEGGSLSTQRVAARLARPTLLAWDRRMASSLRPCSDPPRRRVRLSHLHRQDGGGGICASSPLPSPPPAAFSEPLLKAAAQHRKDLDRELLDDFVQPAITAPSVHSNTLTLPRSFPEPTCRRRRHDPSPRLPPSAFSEHSCRRALCRRSPAWR